METREASGPIRLLDIRAEPLSIDEVVSAVSDPGAGGVVVFIGAVRDADAPAGGNITKEVRGLDYSAHPTAGATLQSVAERVVATYPVRALAAVHRVGELMVGDVAVVVAVACAHRGEAFSAARAMIDLLKAEVPIWKHQRFVDGSDEWVGLP